MAERGGKAHEVLVEHLRRGNAAWVPRAAVVFLATTQVGPGPDGDGGSRHARYDLGQAAAHLTLQARTMGLHAHQFSGFDRDAVAERLAVPAYVELMSGIAVGRRGNPDEVDDRTRAWEEQRERRRKPLAEIAFTDAWGLPWAPG